MIVVYHGADMDGFSSGAIANWFLKDRCKETNERLLFFPMNHGDAYPWTELQKDETIYFLDFPPPAPTTLNTGFGVSSGFEALKAITNNVIWIDHHESSIQKFEGIEIEGLRSNTFPAACELTWKYFSDSSLVPKFVKMISDHDSWRHKIKNSQDFCLGMMSKDGIEDPQSQDWHYVIADFFDDNEYRSVIQPYVEKGQTIDKYVKKNNASYSKSFAYEMEWLGYKCIVCNRGMTGSFLFDSVYDESKHDLMLAWVFDGVKYTVSIYTTKTDKVKANDIAKAHGGGGHPGAAGFTCQELPF